MTEYKVICYLPDGVIVDSFDYSVEFAVNALNRVKKQWTISCLNECTAVVETKHGQPIFHMRKINGRWKSLEKVVS